jgi:hypothetical protein
VSVDCARHGRPGFQEPLSAQAHAPEPALRADKKEVQNEGSGRPGLIGPRSDRAIIAADATFLPSSSVPRSRRMVNERTAGTARAGF